MFLLFSLLTSIFSGRIIANDDVKTPLYGATVFFPALQTGSSTNLQGNFTVKNIPDGTHQVRFSYIGFEEQLLTLTFPLEKPLLVALKPVSNLMEEVVVQSDKMSTTALEQIPISTVTLTDFSITNIPKFLGEPDLIRMVQNLPGVKVESDFTGGFNVRGGRNDQNLILLDGVTVYNPWHLFGIFSAFNTEAVAQVDLSKGVFPAEFGSRLSSVLDIRLQEGSQRKGFGFLSLTPLSASFSYGRPLNQNTSYLISLRRTYFDPVLYLVSKSESKPETMFTGKIESSNSYHFFDGSIKIVHRLDKGGKVEAHVFRGTDLLTGKYKESRTTFDSWELLTKGEFGWQNTSASIVYSKSTTTFAHRSRLSFTRYVSSILDESRSNDESTNNNNPYVTTSDLSINSFDQFFNDYNIQQDFRWFADGTNGISFGWQNTLHNFRDETFRQFQEAGYLTDDPTKAIAVRSNSVYTDSIITKANELSGYINGNLAIGKFRIFPGVRVQHYSAGAYVDILPRVNVLYNYSPEVQISAGYGHFTQYVSVIGLELVRLPTERWFWSDERRNPSRARTATLGARLDNGELGSFSIEAYRRTFQSLQAFDMFAQLDAYSEELPLFKAETVSGSGLSYGTEFFWQKTNGKHSGWVGYTLSWTWNKFEEINGPARFPGRTDRRHDIQAFWSWNAAKNWDIGFVFNFKSGQPITFPTGIYIDAEDPFGFGTNEEVRGVVTGINNFRLPDYHRLDMSVTWKNRRFLWRKAEWGLNIINVYNRQNVFVIANGYDIEIQNDQSVRVTPDQKYIAQLPILPMFSLRLALGGDAQ